MTATFIPEPAFAIDDPQRMAKTDLTRCTLLMNVGAHQLSYAVFDPHDQCFIALKGYYFDTGAEEAPLLEIMEQCFNHDKILFTAFSKIKISFDNPEFTLVPASLFDPALKREYLALLNPEYPHRSLLHDQININSLKAVNVYAVSKNTAGYLKKEFSAARYYHTETAFLSSLLKHEDHSGNRIYVRVLPGRITVVVIASGKLMMMQPYAINHGTDALYHVLNAIRRLHIQHERVQIFLSGEIEDSSPLYKELLYEIPEVSWLRRPDAYHYTQGFSRYPDHHFYHLLSLASCE
jgi:hypothetical protein